MPSRSSPTDRLLAPVSVIIPCLNVVHVLPAQLEALSSQESGDPWEVIVVDNGTSDDLGPVVERFKGRLPAIRLIHQPRRGRHHACNAGAEAARGNCLIFVDADDEVAPGFLRAMAEALAIHPVVAGRLEHERESPPTQPTYGNVQTQGLMNGYGFLPYACGGCLGVHRDVFQRLGGFASDKSYCEDVDFSWRAQLANFRIHFEPRAAVRVKQRQTLRAMYLQHRNFAEGRALLYRDYAAHGMPRRPLRTALSDWISIAKSSLRAKSADEKARLIRRTGRAVGFLRGSLRYRVFYL